MNNHRHEECVVVPFSLYTFSGRLLDKASAVRVCCGKGRRGRRRKASPHATVQSFPHELGSSPLSLLLGGRGEKETKIRTRELKGKSGCDLRIVCVWNEAISKGFLKPV